MREQIHPFSVVRGNKDQQQPMCVNNGKPIAVALVTGWKSCGQQDTQVGKPDGPDETLAKGHNNIHKKDSNISLSKGLREVSTEVCVLISFSVFTDDLMKE